MRETAAIIKFGGSMATNEKGINTAYLQEFFREMQGVLPQFAQAILVIGGGSRVREAQKQATTNSEKDEIGMNILHEHATELRKVVEGAGFTTADSVPRTREEAHQVITTTEGFATTLGGLKIGQSTDTVAITASEIVEQMNRDAMIVILSNVYNIFTADPKLDKNARPIFETTIDDLIERQIVSDDPEQFIPGMSVTIDPVAVSMLAKRPQNLFFGHGRDFPNIRSFLQGSWPKRGTVITKGWLSKDQSNKIR